MKQMLSQQLNWDDFLSLYEVAHEAQLSVSLMVFPRFVVFCEVQTHSYMESGFLIRQRRKMLLVMTSCMRLC